MVEIFASDIQRLAKIKGIKTILRLVHYHHDVISRLVIHQQLTITVVDAATRRILYLFQESVRVGTFLVVVTGNLKCKQTDDIDDHNDQRHTTYHKTSIV